MATPVNVTLPLSDVPKPGGRYDVYIPDSRVMLIRPFKCHRNGLTERMKEFGITVPSKYTSREIRAAVLSACKEASPTGKYRWKVKSLYPRSAIASHTVSVKVFRSNVRVLSLLAYDDSADFRVSHNTLGPQVESEVRYALQHMRLTVSTRQMMDMLSTHLRMVSPDVYLLPDRKFNHAGFIDALCRSSAVARHKFFHPPRVIVLTRTPEFVRDIADDMHAIGSDTDRPLPYLRSMSDTVSKYHSAAAALYKTAESASCALQASIVIKEIQKRGL